MPAETCRRRAWRRELAGGNKEIHKAAQLELSNPVSFNSRASLLTTGDLQAVFRLSLRTNAIIEENGPRWATPKRRN